MLQWLNDSMAPENLAQDNLKLPRATEKRLKIAQSPKRQSTFPRLTVFGAFASTHI
jgi:hypothetical protein